MDVKEIFAKWSEISETMTAIKGREWSSLIRLTVTLRTLEGAGGVLSIISEALIADADTVIMALARRLRPGKTDREINEEVSTDVATWDKVRP